VTQLAKRAFKTKRTFLIRRFLDFLRTFGKSKRGLFGIGIITFYTTIALGAPLFTPNDPARGYFMSSGYAMPVWLKFFGTEDISENLMPVKDPAFKSAVSLPVEGSSAPEWNFTSTSNPYGKVELHYSSEKGMSGLGSARLTFRRFESRKTAGKIVAELTNRFFYPYQAPPKRVAANMSLFVTGAEKDLSVIVTVLIRNSSSFPFKLWSSPTIENTMTAWMTPKTMDSSMADMQTIVGTSIGKKLLSSELVAKTIIPTKSYFDYTVQVTFTDTNSSIVDPRINVYIDDVSLTLHGNAYGLLGTDNAGRDLFAQLVYGARISLLIGLLSAVLSVVIGLVVGLIAGYLGGITDEITMRLTDALLVLPGLPLLLVLIAVLGSSIWNLVMVIGVLGWMGFARMVRSQTLSIKERPFVEAAKAVGAGKWYIIGKHILPNVMSLVYVSLALSVPSAILSEAALSFLGLAPSEVSWGLMLHDAQVYQGIERWWWVVPPGLSIALVSLSFILMGYALDEILNPKLRQRR